MSLVCNPELLKKHVEFLCNTIGVRLAGSDGERKAADYLKEQFLQYSPRVTVEEFPCFERYVPSEKLEFLMDGKWTEFPCSLFSSSPSTNGENVEADAEWFDTASGYQQSDLSYLKDKCVIHLGCHIEKEEDYRRLMEAKPAFILFVDTRYTGTVQLADGLFPAFVQGYGAAPSLNVAYMDVWKWRKAKAPKARIRVTGGMRKSLTTAVICELTGTDPEAGILYAGGHHDTQADTVGADDNAIGSSAVVELARILSGKPHRRTIRLISFGAEEQLSVGSASYVRRHRKELEEKGLFMCNFDSFGSDLGWYEFTLSGSPELRKAVRKIYEENGIRYREETAPCPYTDQFPFAAAQVPGVWIYRKNCDTGLYYHHRVDNTPDILGYEEAARCVTASARLLEDLADRPDAETLCTIPAEDQQKIDHLFQTVNGGF